MTQLSICTGFKLLVSAWLVSVYLLTRVKIYKSVVDPLKCVNIRGWTDLLTQSAFVCGPHFSFCMEAPPYAPCICFGSTRTKEEVLNSNTCLLKFFFCPKAHLGSGEELSIHKPANWFFSGCVSEFILFVSGNSLPRQKNLAWNKIKY